MGQTIMGVAQYPRLPPIVTLAPKRVKMLTTSLGREQILWEHVLGRLNFSVSKKVFAPSFLNKKKVLAPSFFFFKKNVCPVIFTVKKSLCPFKKSLCLFISY